MLEYKKEFIRFMVESETLLFGDFTLKSGRKAPYFINAGKYRTGRQICKLGEYYAECFVEHGIKADVLLGPAYKGIPLSVATAIALYQKHQKNLGFCFDRKEAKDHGEGGMFVGEKPQDGQKICLIEDVMTSGKALKEIMPKILQEAKAEVNSMIISVDRQEKGTGEKSAVEEAFEEFGVRVYSIVTVEDIIEAIEEGVVEGREYLDQMREYLKIYGANQKERQ